jgi:hypothetical protein
MVNKKGQTGWIIFFLLIIIAVVGIIALKNVSTQHGTSKDIVMGYDKGPIWGHAYLKNDHTTAYCFDNDKFIPLLEESQTQDKEVIITYEKYVGRGGLCMASNNYETVVITNVEMANNDE